MKPTYQELEALLEEACYKLKDQGEQLQEVQKIVDEQAAEVERLDNQSDNIIKANQSMTAFLTATQLIWKYNRFVQEQNKIK